MAPWAIRHQSTLSLFLSVLSTLIVRPTTATNPFTQYANDFVNPDSAAAGQYGSNLQGAQDTVIAWAEEMNSHGPWSVTFKPVVAPSGDIHDYMSWAPYQWPDCSKVGNKTALSPAQIRKTCPYVNRDGVVNPDRNIPDDFQSFFNLSDAVLYNSLAHTFQSESSSKYSQNVAQYIKTWFLDKDTAMNPNLNFAQMDLGPTGQKGTFTGILDLRMFAKIASGVLVLRKLGSSDWTSDMDSAFVAWCKQYINWLQTAPTAKQAAAALNNHGTYYAAQLMSVMLLVNDASSATTVGRGYFGGIYKGQIASNGEQPLEASRTRPYHYRNFNIAGMITAARLLKFADPASNDWNTTSNGATIQTAVDFVMTVDPAKTRETNVTEEIYPNVAAVASTYGDPKGTYVSFLQDSGFPYADDAFFLWDQPLAGGSADTGGSSGSDGSASATAGAGSDSSGGSGPESTPGSAAQTSASPGGSANAHTTAGTTAGTPGVGGAAQRQPTSAAADANPLPNASGLSGASGAGSRLALAPMPMIGLTVLALWLGGGFVLW